MARSFIPSIAAASAADLPAIRAFLADAQLPVADLVDSTPVRFWLIRDGERLLGTVALENYADVAVLRSLAVSGGRRGKGLGQLLLFYAESLARRDGIRALCLLTTTASGLFERHGYERIARSDAPGAVRQSEEFRSLCPDSAICMIKHFTIE